MMQAPTPAQPSAAGSSPPPLAAPPSTSAEQTSNLPPDASKTLYVHNLNEKVKLPILKATLGNLFANYGKVLSVVAHDNFRMRGQAFISLESEQIADKARREVSSFPLYGKPMAIDFAKTKSDSIVKLETGSEDNTAFQQHKENRLARKKVSRRNNPIRRKELEKKIRAKKGEPGCTVCCFILR